MYCKFSNVCFPSVHEKIFNLVVGDACNGKNNMVSDDYSSKYASLFRNIINPWNKD